MRILVARYAVEKGDMGSRPTIGNISSRLFDKVAWFMIYFLAVLALPALDVLGLANPSRPQPPDSVFKVDLEGYQVMRLVIGAIFRTVPTAIVLTLIATLGNNVNPDNG
jgi:hypothetical protein